MIADIKDLKVLAVDDNLQARSLMKSMLAKLGINEIYTAKDGKEALDFLGICDDMIDVVLCDWNMPGVTGIELLRQIRTVDPDMPFLMITGAADQGSVTEAKNSGVTGYIAKPYSQDQLEKKLVVLVRMLQARAN